MARRLAECGFAFARDITDDGGATRALVEQARKFIEMWRAMREW